MLNFETADYYTNENEGNSPKARSPLAKSATLKPTIRQGSVSSFKQDKLLAEATYR